METIKPSPVTRFFRLLASEKREIVYIYLYAILAGIISLSLPLGIQSIIGFVSSGQVVTSVVVLMIFILLGVLASGGLQIMQLSLVEHIQQRLFTKIAFDFAFRIPRVQPDALRNQYPPELMNRFFDVLTLQKGMAKLLIEFSAAVLQILFGLILLALYHPYFIVFGLVLVVILGILLRLTGEKGMRTSLMESKYKYRLVGWLEEMARVLPTFKLAGSSSLSLDKTDDIVSHYLDARKSHFRVLVTQYISFVAFKMFITGGLLGLGCLLLINKEINLGQFVASEIIIILTISAIEKILLKLDVVYDVLTAAEKVGAVTDLPMESTQGIITGQASAKGMAIHLKGLRYRFPDQSVYVLQDISLSVAAGEKLCVAGYDASGKTTLLRTLLGLHHSYEGIITYDAFSLRDLDQIHLQEQIGEDISPAALFEGTVLANLTMGLSHVTPEDVLRALDCVGLTDFVQALPEGLHTSLTGSGQRLPGSVARKLVLARCLAKKPRLLVLDDFLLGVDRKEKIRILKNIQEALPDTTLIAVSSDPLVMQWCDRTIWLKEGRIWKEGLYELVTEGVGD
jgi:ABC-type bacteriocin/lantibiotic exporter with double-glycine peptidase domain